MRKLLTSSRAEFALVVTGAFGIFIVQSLAMAMHPVSGPMHSAPRLWFLIAFEVAVLAILGWFLHARGWTAKRIGLAWRWPDVPIGLGLTLLAYLVFYAVWFGLAVVSPPLAQAAAGVQVMPDGLSPWVVGATVAVNPFYEEFFVAGYVITALKDERSATVAINLSVAIRLLYHLYQGVLGVLVIIPMGLIFAYWFVRTGRLWPLVVAHFAIDLIGLLPHMAW